MVHTLTIAGAISGDLRSVRCKSIIARTTFSRGSEIPTGHLSLVCCRCCSHTNSSLVYDHNLGAFHDICGTGGLAHFWREYERATPEFSDHPAFPLVNLDATSFIPCRIFEDDGGIGKHRGMTIAHWSPLLSVPSTTLDVCFPSYVMHSDSSLGLTTSGPLIEALTWSWNVCLSGVWPRRDHRGELMTGWRLEFADRPLAGGFKFVGTHICMDWKASAEAFQLP